MGKIDPQSLRQLIHVSSYLISKELKLLLLTITKDKMFFSRKLFEFSDAYIKHKPWTSSKVKLFFYFCCKM